MKKSLLQLHSAILLAACSGIFGNLISLNAVLITFYRMAFAAVILFLICFCLHKRISFGRADRPIVWSGALLAGHWIFFYGSIKYANVSVGVVCFTLSGFFTALIAPLINRVRFRWSELGLSSLTLVGILLIFHFDDSFKTGILLGIVSAFLFAVYACVNQKINRSHEVLSTTFLQMSGGAVAVMALLPLLSRVFDFSFVFPAGADLLYLLLLAFGCTVMMCVLLNKAQKHVAAFTVSLSFNLEPVYASFWL